MFVYVCLQKDGLGFDRAVEECKARMARYSVTVRSLPTSSCTPVRVLPTRRNSHPLLSLCVCVCARSRTC